MKKNPAQHVKIRTINRKNAVGTTESPSKTFTLKRSRIIHNFKKVLLCTN